MSSLDLSIALAGLAPRTLPPWPRQACAPLRSPRPSPANTLRALATGGLAVRLIGSPPAPGDDGFAVRAHASLIAERAGPRAVRSPRAEAGPMRRLALAASAAGREGARRHDIGLVALHDYDGRRGFELWVRPGEAPGERVLDFLSECDLLTVLEALLRACARRPPGPGRAVPVVVDRAPVSGSRGAMAGLGCERRARGAEDLDPRAPAARCAQPNDAAAADLPGLRRALAREWALLEGGPGTLGADALRGLARG